MGSADGDKTIMKHLENIYFISINILARLASQLQRWEDATLDEIYYLHITPGEGRLSLINGQVIWS